MTCHVEVGRYQRIQASTFSRLKMTSSGSESVISFHLKPCSRGEIGNLFCSWVT